MKTLISLILDRSGSMAGKESDVIGGVNRFIQEQRKTEGEALASIRTFADYSTHLVRNAPLSECPVLSTQNYVPMGGTALLDAVGDEISTLNSEWSTQWPDRAIVVVVTDGEENTSTRYTKGRIQELISQREASGKWNFIYLGASLNAFAEAKAYGFAFSGVAQYVDSRIGTQTAYSAASASVSALRGGALNAGLGTVLNEK